MRADVVGAAVLDAGTMRVPWCRINDGIAAANELGLAEVSVAVGKYDAALEPSDVPPRAGLTLRGGYVVEGERFVATEDQRTTLIVRAPDGLVLDVASAGEGPIVLRQLEVVRHAPCLQGDQGNCRLLTVRQGDVVLEQCWIGGAMDIDPGSLVSRTGPNTNLVGIWSEGVGTHVKLDRSRVVVLEHPASDGAAGLAASAGIISMSAQLELVDSLVVAGEAYALNAAVISLSADGSTFANTRLEGYLEQDADATVESYVFGFVDGQVDSVTDPCGGGGLVCRGSVGLAFAATSVFVRSKGFAGGMVFNASKAVTITPAIGSARAFGSDLDVAAAKFAVGLQLVGAEDVSVGSESGDTFKLRAVVTGKAIVPEDGVGALAVTDGVSAAEALLGSTNVTLTNVDAVVRAGQGVAGDDAVASLIAGALLYGTQHATLADSVLRIGENGESPSTTLFGAGVWLYDTDDVTLMNDVVLSADLAAQSVWGVLDGVALDETLSDEQSRGLRVVDNHIDVGTQVPGIGAGIALHGSPATIDQRAALVRGNTIEVPRATMAAGFHATRAGFFLVHNTLRNWLCSAVPCVGLDGAQGVAVLVEESAGHSAHVVNNIIDAGGTSTTVAVGGGAVNLGAGLAVERRGNLPGLDVFVGNAFIAYGPSSSGAVILEAEDFSNGVLSANAPNLYTEDGYAAAMVVASGQGDSNARDNLTAYPIVCGDVGRARFMIGVRGGVLSPAAAAAVDDYASCGAFAPCLPERDREHDQRPWGGLDVGADEILEAAPPLCP